jgi:AcrR family transcriptional regulator
MDQNAAKDAQRVQLNDALRGVFLDAGYAGASLTRLAAATELGKASLYHYYPGGKAEMAQTLVREAIYQLQLEVFSPLSRGGPPEDQLLACIDGFSRYVAGGQQNCIISLFTAEQAPVVDGRQIAAQFDDWCRQLAEPYVALGQKPKAALRSARQLLAGLYGALALSQLLGDPKEYRRGAKRLKNQLRG